MINKEQAEAKRVQLLTNTEEKLMNKYGWIMHYVFDCPTETGVDIHTHGLVDSFNHQEIQMTLPLNDSVANKIITNCVNKIKSGMVFESGHDYADIIESYQVRFVTVGDNLRMILPDEDGNLDKETMDKMFAAQYGE